MTLKVLDCTIRDGGHLNGWNFSDAIVRASYYAAVKSGVDYFEVGYRFAQPKEEWGKFAKCLDEDLFNLFEVKAACKLTVMIDAGKSDINEFKECRPELTPIRVVRVAAYPYELDLAFELCENLKTLGYEVFLNLMVISKFTDAEYDKLKNWQNKTILESVCFADSFGSFVPDDINYYFDKLISAGVGKISFHSHNNLQLAFANSIKTIELGAFSVDASIYGMGRGSGNLPIEILTGYLEKIGNKKYNPVSYIDVIDRFYLEENEKTPWGYRIQSLIGGLKNIHPYYVDGLFDKHLFTIDEIWTASELVKKDCPISYSNKEMNCILSDKFVNYDDKNIEDEITILPSLDAFEQKNVEFKNIFEGRKVLILANGPSIVTNKERILNFIKKEDCIVIATNRICKGYTPDYHAFVSRKRFLKYADTIKDTSTLLLPSFFGKEIVKNNSKNEAQYFDVVLTLDANSEIFINDKHNYLGLNVAISSIFAAYQMGAKEIYAVGMDGFGKDGSAIEYFYKETDTQEDKKALMFAYEHLSKDLERISRFLETQSIPFSIITPTSHNRFYRDLIEGENYVY